MSCIDKVSPVCLTAGSLWLVFLDCWVACFLGSCLSAPHSCPQVITAHHSSLVLPDTCLCLFLFWSICAWVDTQEAPLPSLLAPCETHSKFVCHSSPKILHAGRARVLSHSLFPPQSLCLFLSVSLVLFLCTWAATTQPANGTCNDGQITSFTSSSYCAQLLWAFWSCPNHLGLPELIYDSPKDPFSNGKSDSRYKFTYEHKKIEG